MNHSTFNPTRIGLVLLSTAFLLPAIARSARADGISYSMVLAEDLNVLKDPNSSAAAHAAAWNTQHTLMLERTTPYVELKNTSVTANITELKMTIGDTTKNFDWATLVQTSPGVGFHLITPDAVAGGATSGVLTIDFTNFTPGSFVIFRTGLSPNDPNALKIFDYRTVLFDMNGGSDTSHNSLVTVNFANSSGTGTVSNPLPNFPNSMPTATSQAVFGPPMDMVVPFITPNFSGSIIQVPEPSSYVLMVGGLAALAGLRLRKRRAA